MKKKDDPPINKFIKGDRIYYHGGWRTREEVLEIKQRRSKLAQEAAEKSSDTRYKKNKIIRECLDCDKRFTANDRYTRLCDPCKGKYRNKMFEI